MAVSIRSNQCVVRAQPHTVTELTNKSLVQAKRTTVYCPGCNVAAAATELHYALDSSEIYRLRESALPVITAFPVVLYGHQT
jgi:hypothetical protein